jgi:hypothetical protein
VATIVSPTLGAAWCGIQRESYDELGLATAAGECRQVDLRATTISYPMEGCRQPKIRS